MTYIYITYININTIILIACICGDVPGTIPGQWPVVKMLLCADKESVIITSDYKIVELFCQPIHSNINVKCYKS